MQKAEVKCAWSSNSIANPEGAKYNIVASLKDAEGADVKDQEGTLQGPSKDGKGTAVETGIGAGAGAGVGAIAHGGTGALYGAAIGAAAGLIHGTLKKGKDIIVPAGLEMTFVIPRDTTAKRAGSGQVGGSGSGRWAGRQWAGRRSLFSWQSLMPVG